jgi:hypothetical protein
MSGRCAGIRIRRSAALPAVRHRRHCPVPVQSVREKTVRGSHWDHRNQRPIPRQFWSSLLAGCTCAWPRRHRRADIGQVLGGAPSNDCPLFQAGHMPSWHGSCECYALSSVAAGSRWPLLLLLPLLSSARRVRVWPPSSPGCGHCAPPLSPIGLTAADPFAGGKVSRAASRVR